MANTYERFQIGTKMLQLVPNMPSRILLFYEGWGWRRSWSAEEVCLACGYVDGDGKPQAHNLRVMRAKLIKDGLLTKVQDGPHYYFVPAEVGLPQVSLDVLSSKGQNQYCNRGEKPLDYEGLLGRLPEVRVGSYEGSWVDLLPGLLDWADANVWKFWTEVFPSALKSKGHPLAAEPDQAFVAEWSLTFAEALLDRDRHLPLPAQPDRWLISSMGWTQDPGNVSRVPNKSEVKARLADKEQDGCQTLRLMAQAWLESRPAHQVWGHRPSARAKGANHE